MSEQKPEFPEIPKTVKVPHVDLSTEFTITVSGGFLKRTQVLLMALTEDMGQDLVKEACERYKNDTVQPNDIREATLFLLMALTREMEEEAVKQNKVQFKDVPLEEVGKIFGLS